MVSGNEYTLCSHTAIDQVGNRAMSALDALVLGQSLRINDSSESSTEH